MQREIWKPIKGYNKTHLVSNLGRMKTLDRSMTLISKTGKSYTKEFIGQIVTPRRKGLSKNNKYYTVTLGVRSTGTPGEKLIHRLVAEAFLPNPKNKPEVNHKDLNPANNTLKNLEWVTEKENKDHAKRMRNKLKKKK